MSRPALKVEEGDAGRTYAVDGKRLPSVTTVLRIMHDEGLAELRGTLGNRRFWQVMRDAGNLGTAVHKACEAVLDPEDIPVPDPDPKVASMAAHFAEWVAATVKEVHHVEVAFADTALGYGGIIDLVATLRGDRKPSVIDIKTSAKIIPSYYLQLAGYREAARLSIEPRVDRRVIVHISKTTPKGAPGKITAVDCPNPHAYDFAAFQAALNLWKWRKEQAA